MKTKLSTLFLLMLLALFANNALANEGHDDDDGMVGMDGMDDHEAANHCTTPTEEIEIIGGENNQLTFDQSEYYVPRNTCVEVIFVNVAIIEHDVSIDEVHDTFEEVHLHLASNTDGEDGLGVISMHIQTPDVDTEYDIYCSVLGHEAGGMKATLIVGEGISDDSSSLPAFGLLTSIFAMSAVFAVYKRKFN